MPEDGPRFGLFIGGIELPDANVTAYAAGAMITPVARRRGGEVRLQLVGYRVEDQYTITLGGALVLHETLWFGGAYGLGFGSGLGYATFEKKLSSGWDDTSLQLLVYVAPVVLRFGTHPSLELGVNVGATRFFEHDVRPFGYAYAALSF
jgi:hypothetical protein